LTTFQGSHNLLSFSWFHLYSFNSKTIPRKYIKSTAIIAFMRQALYAGHYFDLCFPISWDYKCEPLHLMIAILNGLRGNLSVFWICISFIAKDVEHFFMYLLAIFTFSENCLFNSFAHLLIGLCVLLMFSILSSLSILHINPLSDK
jgi:hypothetical protein